MKAFISGLFALGFFVAAALADSPSAPLPPGFDAKAYGPGGNPLIMAAAGSYNGLFFQTSGITHQSSGFVSLKLSTDAAFSGVLLLDGDSVPLSGRFSRQGYAGVGISRAALGKGRLTVALTLDLSNHSDQITGTVRGDNWSAPLRATRAIVLEKGSEAHFAHRFTVVLSPGRSNSVSIAGYGYALGTISAGGVASISGSLADGTSISQSVPVSKNGDWPLYIALFSSRDGQTPRKPATCVGSLLGWLSLNNGAPMGELSWINLGRSNATYYPNGFTNHVIAYGSAYSGPGSDRPGVNFTNVIVELSGGNLDVPLTNVLTFVNGSAAITSSASPGKLSFYRSSGLITGSFFHPKGSNEIAVIKGIVNQAANRAEGFFLGPNESGAFSLRPAP